MCQSGWTWSHYCYKHTRILQGNPIEVFLTHTACPPGVVSSRRGLRLLELTLSRALLVTVAEGRRECELCTGWQSFQLEVTYIMPAHVSLSSESHDHTQLHRDRVCYPTVGLDGKLGIFGEWHYDSHKWYLYLNWGQRLKPNKYISKGEISGSS